MITAALAVVLVTAADLYAITDGGRLAGLAVATTVVSLALLVTGLALRWPTMIPWAVIVSAAGYLITREGRSVVDGWAAVVGATLLLAAELASWSVEHDRRIRSERALVLRRVITLAVLTVVALLVNFLLLATAAVAASASVLLAAVGVAAAVSAVALVLRLVRV